jgi:hypothetical protein
MIAGRRWAVRDRYGNDIFLTHERWEHIIEPFNHPEIEAYEERLKETIQSGKRKQDSLNPHIIAIVLFRFSEGQAGKPVTNNYIVTAYQKGIG